MAGTLKRIAGPAYIPATSENIYTPPASTIQTVLKHIHIANDDVAVRTFSLYIGATGAEAAGTAIFEDVPVAVGGYFDWYCNIPMASTDFLVGIASDATSLVITVTGEQNVV